MRDGSEIISFGGVTDDICVFDYRQIYAILIAETIRERGAKALVLTGIHALKVPPSKEGYTLCSVLFDKARETGIHYSQ